MAVGYITIYSKYSILLNHPLTNSDSPGPLMISESAANRVTILISNVHGVLPGTEFKFGGSKTEQLTPTIISIHGEVITSGRNAWYSGQSLSQASKE